jgi:hypothetical protein
MILMMMSMMMMMMSMKMMMMMIPSPRQPEAHGLSVHAGRGEPGDVVPPALHGREGRLHKGEVRSALVLCVGRSETCRGRRLFYCARGKRWTE